MSKTTMFNPPASNPEDPTGFKDVYRRSQIREANPEKYYPKKPVKNALINTLIFLVSLTVSVSGLLFYGFWRDENVPRARLALAGFWINIALYFIPVLILFFLN